MSPEQQLEDLQAAMLRLRFPTLLGGTLLGLYTLLSLVSALAQFAFFGNLFDGSVDVGLLIIAVILPLLGLLTTALDLLGAGLLIGSGVRGLQARVEPAHLVQAARFLRYFWWVLALRILGALAFTVLQMVAPMVML